jgi:asparagine synthase (glutamine-hydrolysing)
MCGINGIYAYGEAGPVNMAVLRRTRDHMAARGPDGIGEWRSPDKRVAFGHRRLSIIDLSQRGAQPMLSADGQVAVTFNGEIYNYKALRRELEAVGCQFRSESDTEVLIHLYLRHGPAMVTALRGMFAFGLWDNTRQILLLARDPYGIKPLYYADDGRTVAFASTVKALLASGTVPRDPDAAGIVGFYLFGSVPEPFTTYRAIRTLSAGSSTSFSTQGAKQPSRYFSIAQRYREGDEGDRLKSNEVEALFREALTDSVRHHLIADVPVGAFLSAGVDSGALVGLMGDAGQRAIRTITVTYDEFDGSPSDEAPLASHVARFYGTKHTIRRVGSVEFQHDLPGIIEAMDQPSIDGINTWFVSKAARELGLKVAISGVGGDELLGGYTTFRSLPRRVAMLSLPSQIPGAGTAFELIMKTAVKLGAIVHPKTASLLRHGGTYAGAYLLQRGLFLPSELRDVLEDADLVCEGLENLDPLGLINAALPDEPSSPFGKVAALESCFYLRNQLLRDTDWAGMAHSLEIRTPLADHELLRRVAPLVTTSRRQNGKRLLASAPSRPLPAKIVNRPKTGFGIPIEAWTGGLLRPSAAAEAPRDRRLWSRTWAREIMTLHGYSVLKARRC